MRNVSARQRWSRKHTTFCRRIRRSIASIARSSSVKGSILRRYRQQLQLLGLGAVARLPQCAGAVGAHHQLEVAHELGGRQALTAAGALGVGGGVLAMHLAVLADLQPVRVEAVGGVDQGGDDRGESGDLGWVKEGVAAAGDVLTTSGAGAATG